MTHQKKRSDDTPQERSDDAPQKRSDDAPKKKDRRRHVSLSGGYNQSGGRRRVVV